MTLALGPFQDTIVLAGVPSPGIAKVRGVGTPRQWNIRQGYGFSGATIVYAGAGLSKFEVEITLWLNEHWLAWKAFSLVLAKPIPPVVTGLGIQHPLINMSPWNVSSVVVEDVTSFEEDDYEAFTCTLKLIEFRAPVPAIGKPVVSIPTATNPPPTPEDAQDVQMEALIKAISAEAEKP